MSPALFVDGVLAVAAVWLAWQAISGPDLFRSVVLYIVFGLVAAIAWVRLEAPDIALAEAAIGAGLTGALLIDAAGRIGRREDEPPVLRRARAPWVALGLVLAVGAVLLAAVSALPIEPGGVSRLIIEHLPRSGVDHPVTAVLLNFRSLDTWMEVFVLLVAVVALLAVRRAHDFGTVALPSEGGPLLGGVARLLIPLMVLAGGYLLWLGTHAPGGAFQSGAVLASAGVLLLLAGHPSVTALRGRILWLALLPGVLAFLTTAAATLLAGRRLLELPPEHAGSIILLIEVAVTVSIAVTLAALFAGTREPWPRPTAQGREGTREGAP